jgi:iron-sulfur cluster repair protein YtfE (RIC family)
VHPVDRLLEEHRDIIAEVETLRAAIVSLNAHGDAALPAALPALRSVGRMMATQLLSHARKEDKGLFPAIERALGTTDTPIAVMREEHRAIHADARRFRAIVHELNDVEHPAIEAGGETLRTIADHGASAAALAETGEEIIRLLDLHFAKEENVLFPMARAMLSDEELGDVGRVMDALESAQPTAMP